MTKKRFSDILREYDFNEEQIELLWGTRPSADLCEDKLRETAEHISPIKDILIQG